MLRLEDTDLTFLIITQGFWGKGNNIVLLKRKASRDSTWSKGAVRQYFLYLVHRDTEISDEQKFAFPSKLAHDSAIYLGTV